MSVATSVLGLVAVAAAFFPPVGTAIAAVAGIASAIIGAFGSGPSDVEVISGLIEAQTEEIANMLEEQTKILLNSIRLLGKQQVQLADSVVKTILEDNYHQMIDDMHGKIVIPNSYSKIWKTT